MTIYLDTDYRCYASENDNTVQSAETNFFDGKCDAFIEGYRFIPAGNVWTSEDGVAFCGEMIAPWTDYSELEAAQRDYEQQMLKKYEALINELYAEVTE